MDEYSYLIIFLSLLFSAFFSGMEIAFVSSSKLKIELEKKGGSVSANIYSYFLKHEGAFISTMLVGNNIALVVYGYFMALILEPMLVELYPNRIFVFLMQTVLSTTLVLITAEFLPKTIFRINPNRTLNVFAFPTVLFYAVLAPVVYLTLKITNLILRITLGEDNSSKEVNFGKVDLDNYLKEATSQIENKEDIEHEVQILQNALDFNEVKVRECMVPRTEITAVDQDETIDRLRNLFIETGLSKILVFREDIDNIIGYVHSFELMKQPKEIKEVLLPVSLIPEAMLANDALKNLNKNKRSVAVVLDEFGGTSGIVTTEDLIEEIVGEIEDEHDKEELLEKQINEREFLFSARMEVDAINQKYSLNLPDSAEYETLGGLVIHASESIPEKDEIIEIDEFQLIVEEVAENKIERVKIIKKTNE